MACMASVAVQIAYCHMLGAWLARYSITGILGAWVWPGMAMPAAVTRQARERWTLEKIRYERDLHEPVRQYLSDAGFEVRAEVNSCDLVARRPDRLFVVELKRHLSFDLLVQAVERQGYADGVYVAIPKPADFRQDKEWRDRLRVLRRLGLGLLLVGRAGDRFLVEEALTPEPQLEQPKPVRAAPKKRKSLEKEFASRRLDLNIGGSRGVPLVTAYREAALFIAFLLDRHGPSTPKALRGLGGSPQKTTGILRFNPYGWFARGEEHVYSLTDAGREALSTYAPLVEAFHAMTAIAAPDAATGEAIAPDMAAGETGAPDAAKTKPGRSASAKAGNSGSTKAKAKRGQAAKSHAGTSVAAGHVKFEGGTVDVSRKNGKGCRNGKAETGQEAGSVAPGYPV